MEYQFSEEIDPRNYDTHGLASDAVLRMHKDPFSEMAGALRAQRDWTRLVSPIYGYKGGLGDRYSFIRVTVPECLPERLEIVSYANEYAFLYDDQMENLDLKHLPEDGGGMLETFGAGFLESKIGPSARPEKQIQAQILTEMMAIDPARAKTSMAAWAKFVQLASKTRKKPFDTLQQYVPARVVDAGEMIWFGTLTFAMALTIPDEEYDLCMELARPGYAALGLTNDLYSWEKERREAKCQGKDHVFNAVWVIQNERRVGEEEAKAICSEAVRGYIEEYGAIVQRVRGNKALSRDLRVYIEAVMLSITGNLVWSIHCPRYHNRA